MVYKLSGTSGIQCRRNSPINPKDHTGKKATDVSCLKHTEAGGSGGLRESVNRKRESRWGPNTVLYREI